ncbi:MAG: hypothetical protein WDO12_08665 [Pseudomonadota bacterium]
MRIRGASGLSNGLSRVDDREWHDLRDQEAALSYIGDTYTILPAGATSVVISVDNVVQSTTPQTLVPGNDYTLLAYDAGTIGAPRADHADHRRQPRADDRLFEGQADQRHVGPAASAQPGHQLLAGGRFRRGRQGLGSVRVRPGGEQPEPDRRD